MIEPRTDDEGVKEPPATGDEARLSARLEALGDKIEARRAEIAPPASDADAFGRRGAAMGMRLTTEFVAGVLVGGAIGWFIDGWLGTSPWGLVAFLLLGFAAGVLNALRTAGVVQESPARQRTGRKQE